MVIDPQTYVGTWRRFGAAGPLYEIVAVESGVSGDEPMMRVKLLDGQEALYSLRSILDDPRES